MDERFLRISQKYYKTDEDRLDLLKENALYAHEIEAALLPIVDLLSPSGLRIAVFAIDNINHILIAGIFHCCLKNYDIGDDIYVRCEELMINSKYRIRWEK